MVSDSHFPTSVTKTVKDSKDVTPFSAVGSQA